MFDQITGLPAHPLIVHAAVVFTPLLIAVGLLYVVIPPLRRRIGWVLVILSLIAPAVVFAAKESGAKFKERQTAKGLGPGFLDRINEHQNLGDRLALLVYGLAATALILVLVDGALRRRRPARTSESDTTAPTAPARKGGRGVLLALSVILSLGVLGLGGAAGYYVYKTGDSGARMVWGS